MKPIYISDSDYFRWRHNGNEYVLHIQRDEFAENPRSWGPTCTLVNFTNWNLCGPNDPDCKGDSPETFWQNLVLEHLPEEILFNKAVSKPGLYIKPDSESPGRYTWEEEGDSTVYGNLTRWQICQWYAETLSVADCQILLHPYLISLPVWDYYHSGLTISCGDRVYPYNDRWDSGLVGWIIYTKKADDGEDWRDKARGCMQDEIKALDAWLQGEVYGFNLYENKKKVDSCWGFYGNDLMQNGILDEGPGLTEALASDSYTTGQARKETTVTYYFD